MNLRQFIDLFDTTFRVVHYEAIRSILKSWIPHIVILEPEEFRESLLEDVKRWVRLQEKVRMR